MQRGARVAAGFILLSSALLVAHLVAPDCEPDELTAKKIVELFLAGAAPKKRAKKK